MQYALQISLFANIAINIKVVALVKNFPIMKKAIIFLFLLLVTFVLYSQQMDIPRVNLMPDKPEPYVLRDWKKVAIKYDSLVFNTDASGTYLPLSGINESGVNYPESKSLTMATYVGQTPHGGAEAINVIPALVSASLAGIDKRNQFNQDWVRMVRDFFNKKNGTNIYLNNYSGSTGNDWWYETMPNVFFYQLYDIYPETSDFDQHLISVADRWHEAVEHMGGSATPWNAPYMNYRAWNFSEMEPQESGVKQPEAAGAIAWILYQAYQHTQQEKYRIGAEWAMEFLNNWETNPNYELQLAYGVYTAARMNAELGTQYDLEKLINWSFDRGPLRGWGIITGKWGDYDCSGLRGEANDQGNDYAFLMNGIQQAVALVPAVKYQQQYANAMAKWVLNMVNASRLFYPGYLSENQQDNSDWAEVHDPYKTVAHEAMKEQKNGQSPYATGDAIDGGWAPTNLSLYSSSHAGYLGALVSPTNVDGLIRINLNATDFFSNSFPTSLLWNPYSNDTTITLELGEEPVNVYDSRTNQVISQGVSGEWEVIVPAKDSRLLVYLPENAEITHNGNQSLALGKVFDYDNGQDISQTYPRIKAFKALQNPVETGDSLFLYCTAEGEQLQYDWSFNNGSFDVPDYIALPAPQDTGIYEAQVIVTNPDGFSDTASLNIEVQEKIPFAPVIEKIEAEPRKVETNEVVQLTCFYTEENGDVVDLVWSAENGAVSGQGEAVTWTAPAETGDYYVYCTATDVDGSDTDSLKLMVRDFDSFTLGEPVLHLPFHGNAQDASSLNQSTNAYALYYDEDSIGTSGAAASFNGSASYVRVHNHESLNFQNQMAVSGWMRPNHDNQSEAYLMSHGSWESRWKISLNNHVLRATINTTAGILDVDSEPRITNQKWYHFAAVYTGEDLELYINGKLDAFNPWNGMLNQTALDLTIGKARPDQEYFFTGRLDELFVFDHALAPTHVKEIMDNGLNDIPLVNQPLKRFSVYPNPASNEVFVEYSGAKPERLYYRLMTVNGNDITSGMWNAEPGSRKKISSQSLKSGLYLLYLKSKTRSVIKKVSVLN